MNRYGDEENHSEALLHDSPPSFEMDDYVNKDAYHGYDHHEQKNAEVICQSGYLVTNHGTSLNASSLQRHPFQGSEAPGSKPIVIPSGAADGTLDDMKSIDPNALETQSLALEQNTQQGSLENRIEETQFVPLLPEFQFQKFSGVQDYLQDQNLGLTTSTVSSTQEVIFTPIPQNKHAVPFSPGEPSLPASHNQPAKTISQAETMNLNSLEGPALEAAQINPKISSSRIQPYDSNFLLRGTASKSRQARLEKLPDRKFAVQQIQDSFKFGKRPQFGTKQPGQDIQKNLVSFADSKDSNLGQSRTDLVTQICK